MLKNKHTVIGLGALAVIAAAAIGFWASQDHNNHKTTAALAASTKSNSSNNTNSTQTEGSNSTAMEPGLQSSSNSSQPASTPSGTTNSSSSLSSSAAALLDPSTFAKYDQYKDNSSALFIDLQVGTGATLATGQEAAVYYKGWLTNGTLFDQSRPDSSGQLQPFTFTLGQHQVIAGWEQALAGMKVGGVRLVIVPPAVGYGAAGQGSIPGNSVLVFQVQLAAVQ